MEMDKTTWTVDVSYFKIKNTHYFRSEEEADNFISQTKYTLHQMGMKDVQIIKESHVFKS